MKNRCITEQISMHLKSDLLSYRLPNSKREVGVGIEGAGKLWIKQKHEDDGIHVAAKMQFTIFLELV